MKEIGAAALMIVDDGNDMLIFVMVSVGDHDGFRRSSCCFS